MAIDILLATHNGETFVEAQIASILDQHIPGVSIHVHDDGSTDCTPRIIQALSRSHSGTVCMRSRSATACGVVASYSELLRYANAEYIMLCDQDDIWLPSRIELAMARIRYLESVHGKDWPILVHTDLTIVDDSLTTVHDSFVACHGLDAQRFELNRLLVKNVVTGCTMTFNAALRQLVGGAIPLGARMHDWWIALVASLFGTIDFIAEPTVLYRQHGHNAVGMQPINLKFLRNRWSRMPQLRSDLVATARQTEYLLKRYGRRMQPRDRQVCRAFLDLFGGTAAGRVTTCLRHRFFSHGLWRNVGLLLMVAGLTVGSAGPGSVMNEGRKTD